MQSQTNLLSEVEKVHYETVYFFAAQRSSEKQEGNLLAQRYISYHTHYQHLMLKAYKCVFTFLYQKRPNLLKIS